MLAREKSSWIFFSRSRAWPNNSDTFFTGMHPFTKSKQVSNTRQMTHHHHLSVYWLPVFLYCFLIFLQSSFPASESIPVLPFVDKCLHFAAYALLGALVLRAVRRHFGNHQITIVMILSITLTTLYGFSDELHQSFVPSRSADAADLLADALGAVFGVFVYRYVVKRVFFFLSVSFQVR